MNYEPDNSQNEAGAAIACAGAISIVSIIAGQDGKIAIREIVKILQAIRQ